MATFATIRSTDDPVELQEIQIGTDVYSNLTAYQTELSMTLGFRVTIEQAIGYLLFNHPERDRNTTVPRMVKLTPDSTPITEDARQRLLARVHDLMKAQPQEKIAAIKLVREVCASPLKEAKDFVESLHPNF